MRTAPARLSEWVVERLDGVQHSAQVEHYDRVNARLTKAEKSELSMAKKYGAPPKRAMTDAHVC